ncbi:MAG: hypothetical protein QF467_07035 [SAR202 cluster bacterium]|nr:hypothetical protein [SAR202 cluster bacterium]
MKQMITRFVAAAALVAIMAISMAVATSDSAHAASPPGKGKHSAGPNGPSPTQGIVKEPRTNFNLFWD